MGDEDSRQCDSCIEQLEKFDFYSDGWFVEGNFYCNQHIIDAVEIFKKVVKETIEMQHRRQEGIEKKPKYRSGF